MANAITLPAPQARRFPALGSAILGSALGVALIGAAVVAQVAGDRGIAPVASSTDIEVRGIEVNTTGKTSDEARYAGWRDAQKQAWKKIGGPDLPEGRIDSLVSAIVVQREQLGPHRYIATLGVIFDRARAGGLLGGGGERARSAPMLTLPVLDSAGTQTMFEVKNPWQQAWAEYQAGASAIDYVRPSGAGAESLLLTYGQTGRRSRLLWNDLLDQFGAADVLVPVARLTYSWPGGPVEGHFTGRYGPDNRMLGSFVLKVQNSDQVPAMLNRAVERFDQMFAQALTAGTLRPDPTLALGGTQLRPEIVALIDASRRADAAEAAARAAAAANAAGESAESPIKLPYAPVNENAPVGTFTVQVATPDAGAFDSALASIRSTPGVRGVATPSLAIGGTSVMRVSFAGEIPALAAALRARGWQVSQGANAVSITR
ncbi:MAG: hypothetical protein RLZZ08_453 [Pseudomonadota bacterium]|jgi:hypothetical protein